MAGTPNPTDIIVGNNVKALRAHRGISQSKLGDALGLTFQQVQKYERGSNRISASKLLQIAGVLNVKVETLFQGTVESERESFSFGLTQQAMEVARSYDRLDSTPVKYAVRLLLSTLDITEGALSTGTCDP